MCEAGDSLGGFQFDQDITPVIRDGQEVRMILDFEALKQLVDLVERGPA